MTILMRIAVCAFRLDATGFLPCTGTFAARGTHLFEPQHRVDRSLRRPGPRFFSRGRTGRAACAGQSYGCHSGNRSGEVHALGSIASAIRAIPRGAPIKALAVSLRRPVFWLVTRPELKSFNDLKGKVMGTTTIGGSQHTAGVRLLRKAGLNPDKDLTVVLGGDVPTQLQALVNGSIQVGILSPPTVIVARDKYKMNILGSAMDEFTSIQNGLAVLNKSLKEQRDLVKRILRARAKANRYFHQNERGTSEVLAKYLSVDFPTALETYRISRTAFTSDGIPTDEEINEYLKADAQILGLPTPLPAARVFDFSLQREVNKELGAK
jgi:ABC-type nitrate/sulfonate/bicarbonate transport system substrate-binding protein